MKRATIHDVAERANVSIATVSRVFNRKEDRIPISPVTADRVRKAASELNYTPNSIARSLVSRRTNIIGLVVPDIVHNYFPEIIRGIEAVAYDKGYQVILCDSQDNPDIEARQITMLLERQCDGVLIAPSSSDSIASIQMLKGKDVPVVLVDRCFGDQFDCVASDSYSGACMAVNHLIKLGHRRIAHIRGTAGLSSAEDAVRGYKQALAAAGIQPGEELIRGSGYYENDGYTAMKELIALPSRPSAVFAANDPLAIGALQAISDSDLRVPDDFAIVGSANLSFAGLLSVPLTTLDEQALQIGKEAAALLAERLQGSKSSPRQLLIKPNLVIRKSCGQNP